MNKFKPFGRRKFNALFRGWCLRNWKGLLGLGLGMLIMIGLFSGILLLFMPHTPWMWWSLGVLQAALIGVTLHLVNAAFFAHEGEAIHQMRGAWGEENTRDELKRARRKGHVWGWVDSIQLQGFDIDHLVVTKDGGLLAIDTKWRSQGPDIAALARDASRAALRAEGVARSILTRERGARHRLKTNALGVRPVVVVWGAAQHHVLDNGDLGDVNVIAGRQLCNWIAGLQGEPVSKDPAEDLIRRLEEFRAGAWARNS